MNAPLFAEKVTIEREDFPEWWFSPEVSVLAASRCQSLWCAVIANAIQDAYLNNSCNGNGVARHDAILWLTRNSQGLREVCALAGLEHTKVIEWARKKFLSEGLLDQQLRPARGRVTGRKSRAEGLR
jgi:hypothetical protein